MTAGDSLEYAAGQVLGKVTVAIDIHSQNDDFSERVHMSLTARASTRCIDGSGAGMYTNRGSVLRLRPKRANPAAAYNKPY